MLPRCRFGLVCGCQKCALLSWLDFDAPRFAVAAVAQGVRSPQGLPSFSGSLSVRFVVRRSPAAKLRWSILSMRYETLTQPAGGQVGCHCGGRDYATAYFGSGCDLVWVLPHSGVCDYRGCGGCPCSWVCAGIVLGSPVVHCQAFAAVDFDAFVRGRGGARHCVDDRLRTLYDRSSPHSTCQRGAGSYTVCCYGRWVPGVERSEPPDYRGSGGSLRSTPGTRNRERYHYPIARLGSGLVACRPSAAAAVGVRCPGAASRPTPVIGRACRSRARRCSACAGRCPGVAGHFSHCGARRVSGASAGAGRGQRHATRRGPFVARPCRTRAERSA